MLFCQCSQLNSIAFSHDAQIMQQKQKVHACSIIHKIILTTPGSALHCHMQVASGRTPMHDACILLLGCLCCSHTLSLSQLLAALPSRLRHTSWQQHIINYMHNTAASQHIRHNNSCTVSSTFKCHITTGQPNS
eukprot:GHRR01014596.1.p1 GENE.GHRR01014596.1~~GHRR01014596.1.p1  ORF type:complete len:134 (+),score=22.19 GHRR01014596.1:1147-1548(+)